MDSSKKERMENVLKEFGINPSKASKEEIEKAEYIAEKTKEFNRRRS